jgi:gliding motility-associated-like protein
MRFLILFFLTFSGILSDAMATHIIGGDLSVRHKSGTTYIVEMNMYRDCNPGNAPFNDEPLYVGLYDKEGNTPMDTINVYRTATKFLEFQELECVRGLFGCVEVRRYSGEFEMPANKFNNLEGYYVSWERCCRNHIIRNVFDPGSAGMAFYAEINSPFPNGLNTQLINSNPKFGDDPQSYLCLDLEFTTNFGVTDPDGDQLKYSIVTPLAGNTRPEDPNGNNNIILPGPYQEVIWENGYSVNNVMDGTPSLSINENTGDLTVTPTKLGAYVVAVLIEEFRNGMKIGETRRELQFYVIECFFPVAPEIKLVGINNSDPIKVFMGEEFCQTIVATDEDASEILDVTVEALTLDPFALGAYFNPENPRGSGIVNADFCWKVPCNLTPGEPFTLRFIVSDDGCSGPKSDTAIFTFTPEIPPNKEPYFAGNVGNSLVVKSGQEFQIPITLKDDNPEDALSVDADVSNLEDEGFVATFEPDFGAASVTGVLSLFSPCAISKPESYMLTIAGREDYCGGYTEIEKEIEIKVVPSILDGNFVSPPNSFSPNDDGINDVFFFPTQLKEICNFNFHLEIFSRWGNKVLETDNPQFEWDGKDAPDGVYVYRITSDFYEYTNIVNLTR